MTSSRWALKDSCFRMGIRRVSAFTRGTRAEGRRKSRFHTAGCSGSLDTRESGETSSTQNTAVNPQGMLAVCNSGLVSM